MPLTDKWTRAQIRTAVQRELADPNAKWWPVAELNNYIEQWQSRLQDKLELVWGSATATVTTSTSTLTLTAVATDILRLDAIYWNDKRLVMKTKGELDVIQKDWRGEPANLPIIYYQDNLDTVTLWPVPSTTGTAVFEYPKALTFSTDTSTMGLPAFTRYSAIDYCLYRTYLRHGPNQDINKAMRKKKKWVEAFRKFLTIQQAAFPQKFLALRPGGKYEKDLLEPDTNVWS